jgi:hypothetical protein
MQLKQNSRRIGMGQLIYDPDDEPHLYLIGLLQDGKFTQAISYMDEATADQEGKLLRFHTEKGFALIAYLNALEPEPMALHLPFKRRLFSTIRQNLAVMTYQQIAIIFSSCLVVVGNLGIDIFTHFKKVQMDLEEDTLGLGLVWAAGNNAWLARRILQQPQASKIEDCHLENALSWLRDSHDDERKLALDITRQLLVGGTPATSYVQRVQEDAQHGARIRFGDF